MFIMLSVYQGLNCPLKCTHRKNSITRNLKGRVNCANDLCTHVSTSKIKNFTYPNQGLTFSNIGLDKQYIAPAAEWNFRFLT